MVELNIPLSIMFTIFALLMVVGSFCFFLFRWQRVSKDEQGSRFDAGELLLICLSILAIIVLFGSALLLFFENHFQN